MSSQKRDVNTSTQLISTLLMNKGMNNFLVEGRVSGCFQLLLHSKASPASALLAAKSASAALCSTISRTS
eukprot:scaffold27474_cov14-Tisochrysis_lutea.AAC.1